MSHQPWTTTEDLKRSAAHALALWKVKRHRRLLVWLVWPELARTLKVGVEHSRRLDAQDAEGAGR